MSSKTYGIDVHGTLAVRTGEVSGIAPSTLFPLLKPLMAAWMRQGQLVFIVSGPPKEWIERELAVLRLDKNVHYYKVISMVDELPLLFPDAEIWPDPVKEGHFWTDEETWVRIKGAICEKYGIDILVDDTEDYGWHLPPMVSFVHVKASLLQSSGLSAMTDLEENQRDCF
jgi:hypothetical protein